MPGPEQHDADLKYLIENSHWLRAKCVITIPGVYTYSTPLNFKQVKEMEAHMSVSELSAWTQDIKARAYDARRADAAEDANIKAFEARKMSEAAAEVTAMRVEAARKRRRSDEENDEAAPVAEPVNGGLAAAAAAAAGLARAAGVFS